MDIALHFLGTSVVCRVVLGIGTTCGTIVMSNSNLYGIPIPTGRYAVVDSSNS